MPEGKVTQVYFVTLLGETKTKQGSFLCKGG